MRKSAAAEGVNPYRTARWPDCCSQSVTNNTLLFKASFYLDVNHLKLVLYYYSPSHSTGERYFIPPEHGDDGSLPPRHAFADLLPPLH